MQGPKCALPYRCVATRSSRVRTLRALSHRRTHGPHSLFVGEPGGRGADVLTDSAACRTLYSSIVSSGASGASKRRSENHGPPLFFCAKVCVQPPRQADLKVRIVPLYRRTERGFGGGSGCSIWTGRQSGRRPALWDALALWNGVGAYTDIGLNAAAYSQCEDDASVSAPWRCGGG